MYLHISFHSIQSPLLILTVSFLSHDFPASSFYYRWRFHPLLDSFSRARVLSMQTGLIQFVVFDAWCKMEEHSRFEADSVFIAFLARKKDISSYMSTWMTRFEGIGHSVPLNGAVLPKVNKEEHFEVLRRTVSDSHEAVPSGFSGRCIERQDWLCCQVLDGARKQPASLIPADSDYSAPPARAPDCKDDCCCTTLCRYCPHCWASRKRELNPVTRNPSCHQTKMLLEPVKNKHYSYF